VNTVTSEPGIREKVDTASADAGFFSEDAVKGVEQEVVTEPGETIAPGPIVNCAVEKQGHHRNVKDLEKKGEPEAVGAEATVKEKVPVEKG
jgi:hypothetical protein